MFGPGTKYTYAISTDFPLGKMDVGRLDDEISGSSLGSLFDGVSRKADVCIVRFTSELSSSQKEILDGNVSPPSGSSLIGSHTGEPVESEPVWIVEQEKAVETSSTNYITALKLNTDSLSAGSYYLHWGFNLSGDRYTGELRYKVMLDGETTLIEDSMLPPLCYRGRFWTGGANDISYFKKLELPAGTHSISIHIASSSKSQTVIMKHGRVELTQV
jgi:hypothetical protein